VGAAGYVATGFREELLSLPPLIVGSMLGAWFGVRLRELAPQRMIRYGFAMFMILAAVLTLADALSTLSRELETIWTGAGGLRIHDRASDNPAPEGRTVVVLVHGLVISSRYMVPTAERLAPITGSSRPTCRPASAKARDLPASSKWPTSSCCWPATALATSPAPTSSSTADLSPFCEPNSDQLTAHQPSRSPDSYRELVGFLHRRFDKSTGG
jgi:hypothetical protein